MSYKFLLPQDNHYEFTKGDPTKSNNYSYGSPSDLKFALDNPGVYIIGVKSSRGLILNNLELTDKEFIFCAFYVGMVESNSSIFNRVVNKHYPNYSNLKSKHTKELFNWSVGTNICEIYAAIEKYNHKWILNNQTRGSRIKHDLYAEMLLNHQNMLIFFQCSSYINYLLNIDVKKAAWYDMNHYEAYARYITKSGMGTNFGKYLEDTKKMIEDNFYFVYCSLEGMDTTNIYEKEAECKWFLKEKYEIFTSNELENKDNIRRWKELEEAKQNETPIINDFDFTDLDKIIFKRNILCNNLKGNKKNHI
jgi:hypothetical protein